MTQKKKALWALACSCSFVVLAYVAMQNGNTAVGNRAVYVLFPGIMADLGFSGNPHSGSGDLLGPTITFGVSIAVWFSVAWLSITIVDGLRRYFSK